MVSQQNVRVFGAKRGAAGVSVIERSGANALADPRYGSSVLAGLLNRGPMGIPVPFSSQAEYQDVCGDPKDPSWHLFADGSHLLPDAIDGYYKTGGGAGQLWLIRLDLDGKAKRSELILKNRVGADCLKIQAANEGRWGGRAAALTKRPIIYGTMTTFTLVAPGTLANEFVGADVEFTSGSGKKYKVVSNTAAVPDSGEVIFTIGSQYNLVLDGVSGPTTLTGTATYERYAQLAGTVSFAVFKSLSGTVSVNGRVVSGVGTQFTSQLAVGRSVYLDGEARIVDSISSDTTATITDAFSTSGAGVSLQIDNLQIVGVGTQFATELIAGQKIYATINGERVARTIASIDSATALTLASGFESALAAAIVEKDGKTVVGTTSAFTSQLQVGAFVIDPNRAGSAAKVISIESATGFTIEEPFSSSFSGAQLVKQSQQALVTLTQNGTEGLAIEVGQGVKFPATHFSLGVRFNGSLVYQASDASLDPNDQYFVEPLINDDGNNIAYRTGASNYQKWITVESLWDSNYTTNAQADVRPCNGSDVALEVTDRRLYTIAGMDYSAAVGQLLYPNPYKIARSYVRVTKAAAPVTLQGTLSSLGTVVTGVGSNFRSVLKVGDYLYDSVSKSVRKIRAVLSDTVLNLTTAFASNIPALTQGIKAGYLEAGQGYDLREMASVGDRFLSTYPQHLSGGYDGNTAALIPYYWSKFADLDANVIENAVWGKNAGLVRIACPGVSDVVVQRQFSFYAQQTAYEFRAEIPSNYLSAATAENFLNQQLGRSDFQVCAFPSYGFISSPYGNGDRFISLSGDIMGGESAYAVVAQGWHQVFAGVDAVLPRVSKLPIEVKPAEEAIVNVAGIQPIKSLYGRVVVFGGRSNAISGLYDFIHIRRIQSNYVRVFLESRELLQQMFKPNQPYLVDQVIMILNNWARKEYKKGVFSQHLSFRQAVEIAGGLQSSGVITDDKAAAGLVEIINGKLRIYVAYTPTGIVEELSINLGPEILTAQYGNSLRGALL